MQIAISGKQIEIGESLQNRVNEDLSKVVKKYFEFAVSAKVVFSKEAHLFRADISVNEGTGNKLVVKADATAKEIYACFDAVMDRIEKQLRRYKRRIKNHHKPETANKDVFAGTKYVISSNDEKVEEQQEDNPLIIAEKDTVIEILSVSDAVMRMDLGNVPALMFINSKNGNLNVIYRRADGNISWVDPCIEEAKKKKSA